MGFIFASAGIVTSVFYIIIILLSKTKHSSKWWLIFFLGLLSLSLLPILLMNFELFPPIYMNASTGLLWGPVLYFYITSLLKEKFNFKSLPLHLLPFLIYYSLSIIFNIDIIPGPPHPDDPFHSDINHKSKIIFSIVQLCSLMGYSLYTLYVLNKHEKNIQNHYSYKDVYLTIRWSYAIIIYFGVAYIVIVLTEQLMHKYLQINSGDLQMIIISMFIYILGYLGIKQQPVYLNMIDDVKSTIENELSTNKNQNTNSKEKYSRNKLDNELKEKYKVKLLTYLENEKPFLQAKLSINDLSDSLQIQKHFLSQIINDSLGHTFYSLINSYRVEEVKRRIEADKEDKFTLLAIAFDSGFNSKSGFNNNFKLETGMTPIQYKNAIKNS